MSALSKVVSSLLTPGKGILAADESTRTMNRRLAAIDTKQSPEMRERFRELLFTTDGIGEYLSGVILFDSSIRSTVQSGPEEGTLFPDVLVSKGIIPGIKVDKGTVSLEGYEGEVVTQGLDGLRDRLLEYQRLGAQFAKWRAVITIDTAMPTDECIRMNAYMLARYAAICQKVGVVPIVEPEVLFAGHHDINRAERVVKHTLRIVFEVLDEYKVDFSDLILKSSMVLAGDQNPKQSKPEEVAQATLRALKESVPSEVPGIVFLSGGQTPTQATENLSAIVAQGSAPWALTFSYARALEEPVLAAWKGREENVAAAQKVFLHRLRMNTLAQKGEYTKDLEIV